MADIGGSQTAQRPTRRRGAALEQAIFQASLEELAATGYGDLTMEGVARRARTGKAALYRRWPTKKDLVLDALLHVLPDPREVSLSDRVRDNLLAALTVMADTLAGRTTYPSLDVLLQVLRVPELGTAFRAAVIEPRLSLVHSILVHAASTGEISSESATPLIARTGPALVVQTFLLTGQPPTAAEITDIVDTILIPLLKPATRISRS